MGKIDELVVELVRVYTSSKYWHWLTTSEAEHNAATYLHDGIDDHLDAIVESYQGYNNKRIVMPSGLPMIPYRNMKDGVIDLRDMCEGLLKQVKEEDIKNLLAEVISTCNIFIYKLSLR